MSGIFGTNAVLITDINLLIQIISFIILLIGLMYKTKGNFRLHGSFMGLAVLLHLTSFFLAMGPSFTGALDFFITDTSLTGVQTMWVHAMAGAIALVLGIVLIVAWIVRTSNVKGCIKRKRLMDITVLLWSISLIFGVATYLAFYL